MLIAEHARAWPVECRTVMALHLSDARLVLTRSFALQCHYQQQLVVLLMVHQTPEATDHTSGTSELLAAHCQDTVSRGQQLMH